MHWQCIITYSRKIYFYNNTTIIILLLTSLDSSKLIQRNIYI